MLLRHLLIALWVLLTAGAARAQLIDDVELRREGADAVLQVRFVTEVQYLRASIGRSGDLTQAFYTLLPTRQTLNLVTSERRVPARTGAGGAGLPALVVTDESSAGRTTNERRVVVRLDRAAPHRVRAGRGNRSIEFVFAGLGAAVGTQAARTPAVPGGYLVTLETSTAADAMSRTGVPAALQEIPLFTTRRVIDGKELYQTHLGPFASLAQAQSVLARAKPRFPGAQIVDAASIDARVAAPAAPAASAAGTEDFDAKAAALLASAREAQARQDLNGAIGALSNLLELPPNASTREAQALVGDLRLQAGDTARARAEYQLFLRMFPTGADADRVRAAVAALGAPEATQPVARTVTPTTTLSGSVSSFYYGGQSKVRTQEFQDSPIGGLPELVSDATLSAADQKQLVTGVDLNWRHRDADVDQRFVFRDAYTSDFLRSDRSRNKLSALYYDQRWLGSGASVRLGRQSPLGGGVLGRFDGIQAGYAFRPRWKAGVVAGVPTDTLLDARRHFYGASVDADSLFTGFGGSLYLIQQVIDGQVDRRAIGSEMRYFDGGLSATGQVDYDLVLKGMNIATLQGTWQRADNGVVNFLWDRRRAPLLSLGNALFFIDPAALTRPTRISELLETTTVEALRAQVNATTAMSTQASLGATLPLNPRWQIGADVRYTNIGAIGASDVLPDGLPSTGDLWSLGLQAIGTNLYSGRDTHVFIVNLLSGPTYKGQLVSYNNSSQITEAWQLEPSLRVYHQSDNAGLNTTRWSPGLRSTYRVRQQVTLESEISFENSRTTGPSRNETSSRVFYYLGGRYDF
jgi:tetratricopeptide (TPR) repeat protein